MKAFSVFVLLFCNVWVVLDAAAPTRLPSRNPTFKPSTSPTAAPTFLPGESGAPSTNPTRKPTSFPTVKPSASPSTATPTNPTSAPTVRPTTVNQQLFAVVGGSSCAESLYYGPQRITEFGSADGLYLFYLSTATMSRDVPHSEWLEIVTSDGSTELFRIHWIFTTTKTLAQRFADAVAVGEKVGFRVEDASTGQTYMYDTTWRFSGTSRITISTFDVTTTMFGFSANDGDWSTGIQATPTTAWGISSRGGSDASSCGYVFNNGVPTYYYKSKAYMYYFAEPPPPTATPTTISPTIIPTTKPTTATPTVTPTAVPTTKPTSTPTITPTAVPTTTAPSAAPTLTPTYTRTASPSVGGENQLFAVLGGDSRNSICASSLPYGPQAITAAGSADGRNPYFFSTGTTSKDIPHTNWLQVVTSNIGGKSVELFRIYWSFHGAKTLEKRFVDANNYHGRGEDVDYRIEIADMNQTLYKTGTWKFSSLAEISANQQFVYPNTRTSTYCCLSKKYGIWGAGVNMLDGDGFNDVSNEFWGIGNFYMYDQYSCYKVYKNGVVDPSIDNVKVYMYYTAPSPMPTVVPTMRPTTTNQQLFAVTGGDACAVGLPYGPQAITEAGSADGYQYYLSTRTQSYAVPHTRWLQVVTSNRYDEVFRIHWTFRTAKTLAQRFADAVAMGEEVAYQVDELATGKTYYMNGTWWFSSKSKITLSTFDVTKTTYGFSYKGGMWAAGTGVMDGADYSYGSWWGMISMDYTDTECRYIRTNGRGGYTYAEPRPSSYMYYFAQAPPTPMPTPMPTTGQPTRRPTPAPMFVPSPKPSAVPTATPTVDGQQQLFAVVGGDSCAENLYYGPQAITESGSADGKHRYYLSTRTQSKDVPHTNWLQIVTSDGANELFRIYWTFTTPLTLAMRFAYWYNPVSYRIVVASTNETFHQYGSWVFSSRSKITSAALDATSTTCCLSTDSGVWGAGYTTVDGGAYQDQPYRYFSFWGIGNWGSVDSTCSYVYRNGVVDTAYANTTAYMYYFAPTQPSAAPTAAPTNPTTIPTTNPTTPTRVPTTTRQPEDPALHQVHGLPIHP